MPLYEYQCDACGHRFEVIRKFSDPPVEACPSCGGVVHKLMSSPAFQFKGTGWYVTDYAKKDHAPEVKSGDSQSDTGAKEKGEKSEKGEKGEKGGKSGGKGEKSGKGSSATDSASSSSSSSTSSTGSSTKDS